MGRASLGLGMLVGCAGLAGCVQQPVNSAADQTYCNLLAWQYDRFAPAGRERMDAGRLQRDIGVDRCQHGDVHDGEAELQKALRAIGIPPAPPPGPPVIACPLKTSWWRSSAFRA